MPLSRKRHFVAFMLGPVGISPVYYSLKVRESANLHREQFWGTADPLFHWQAHGSWERLQLIP